MTHKKVSKKAIFQWKMADGWCAVHAEYKELGGKVFKTTDAQVGVNFHSSYKHLKNQVRNPLPLRSREGLVPLY